MTNLELRTLLAQWPDEYEIKTEEPGAYNNTTGAELVIPSEHRFVGEPFILITSDFFAE